MIKFFDELGIEFVHVKGGTFQMGDTLERAEEVKYSE